MANPDGKAQGSRITQVMQKQILNQTNAPDKFVAPSGSADPNKGQYYEQYLAGQHLQHYVPAKQLADQQFSIPGLVDPPGSQLAGNKFAKKKVGGQKQAGQPGFPASNITAQGALYAKSGSSATITADEFKDNRRQQQNVSRHGSRLKAKAGAVRTGQTPGSRAGQRLSAQRRFNNTTLENYQQQQQLNY